MQMSFYVCLLWVCWLWVTQQTAATAVRQKTISWMYGKWGVCILAEYAAFCECEVFFELGDSHVRSLWWYRWKILRHTLWPLSFGCFTVVRRCECILCYLTIEALCTGKCTFMQGRFLVLMLTKSHSLTRDSCDKLWLLSHIIFSLFLLVRCFIYKGDATKFFSKISCVNKKRLI